MTTPTSCIPCPQKHYCTFVTYAPRGYEGSFACDMCHTDKTFDTGFWHCFLCSADAAYDVCSACSPKPAALDIPTLPVQLADEQLEKLKAVKADALARTNNYDVSDGVLWRYLRLNEWDVSKATDAVVANVEWRRANNADTILKTGYPKQALLKQLVPFEYHGEDRDGRPVFVSRTGCIDVQAFLDNLTEDEYKQYNVHDCETQAARLEEQSIKYGRRIDTMVAIADMEGLSFEHRSIIPYLRVSQAENGANYPLRVHKMHIINVPVLAMALWSVVKSFVPPDVAELLSLHSDGAPAELNALIAPEHLPKEFGGACKCKGDSPCIPIGSTKGLSGAFQLHRVGAGSNHAEVLSTPPTGGRISWDFSSVGDYDIEFSVQSVAYSEPPSASASPSSTADALREMSISPAASSPAAAAASPSASSPVAVGSYVVKAEKVTKHKGEYSSETPASLRLFFNNSHSWMTAKDIKLRVTVE